jgi:hypothetical protein
MRGYTAILPPEPVRFSTVKLLAEMVRQSLAHDACYDRLARVPCDTRQRRRPDAENDGEEVSWRTSRQRQGYSNLRAFERVTISAYGTFRTLRTRAL